MSFAYITNGTLITTTSQRSSFNKRITQAGEIVNGQRFSSLGVIDTTVISASQLIEPPSGISISVIFIGAGLFSLATTAIRTASGTFIGKGVFSLTGTKIPATSGLALQFFYWP